MKTIISKNSTFDLFFGEQEIKKTEYVLASYCVTVECSDGVLIYNNLSKELLLLNTEEALILTPPYSIDNHKITYLIKNWFIHPFNISSTLLCKQLLSSLQLFENKKANKEYRNFTIMTTLECNARCFYCFQKGRFQPKMSVEIANDVADYIIKHSENKKKISITWFGGEPLYNQEVINLITDKLNLSGINYKSKIITNGYLLNETIINNAKEDWNLEKVQITLDGTEKVYNRIKNYIYNDSNPFEKVICNIHKLLDNQLKVIIRLNLGLHNSNDLYNLVDYLYEEFVGQKGFSIYAHRLFDYDDSGKQIHNAEEIIHTIKIFDEFNDYLIKKGFFSYHKLKSDYITNQCMADSDNSVVITPDGKLGKCEHFSDRELIGDIYSDNLDEKKREEWKERQPQFDICNDCAEFINCIRLKNCPDISKQCDLYQREEKINTLKKKIINTYNAYKD